MSYYEKNIEKVDFDGIKYREIKDIDDYSMLEKEVEEVLSKGNKVQFLIKAENLRNQSMEEKEKSMSINWSIVVTLVFGIISIVTGILFDPVKKLGTVLVVYGILVVIYIIIVCVLVTRAKNILQLHNRKITFYDTICRMIKGKE